MSPRQLVALALAAASLAAAGCGGSSKTESTASATSGTTTATTALTTPARLTLPPATVVVAHGTPLTRAQWIVRGDKICRHYQTEIETLAVKRVSELPRVMPQEAAYIHAEVAQLSKLVPPAAQAADWQKFLNESLQWGEGSLKIGEYKGPNLGSSPLIIAVQTLRTHLINLARHDGFQVC